MQRISYLKISKLSIQIDCTNLFNIYLTDVTNSLQLHAIPKFLEFEFCSM